MSRTTNHTNMIKRNSMDEQQTYHNLVFLRVKLKLIFLSFDFLKHKIIYSLILVDFRFEQCSLLFGPDDFLIMLPCA